MMKRDLGSLVGLALLLSTPAFSYPAETVPDTVRNPAAPSGLLVIVPQVEIRASINPAGGAGGANESIVGALIVGAMDASRAKKTEDKAEQIRSILDGFDVDELARAETAKAFAPLSWVNTSEASFGKDPTLWGKMAVLDKGNAPHLVIVNYEYEMTPDLSGVMVYAVTHIVDKVNPKAKTPEKRFLPERLTFGRVVYTTTSLAPDPSGKAIDGATAWAADDGKLLKMALQMGVAKSAQLAARTVSLTPDDLVAMNAKDMPKLNLGFHRGRVVEGADSLASAGKSNGLVRASATVAPGGEGVLIWAGYFVHARVLPLAQN